MPENSEPDCWRTRTHRDRCRTVAGTAAEIVAAAAELVERCRSDQRTDDLETIASELIPLCDALAFLRRGGPRVLQTRRLGARGRPAWLWGVTSSVSRQPHGRVLVIGTWNYPLLLVGVQIAQALAAGNLVTIKPAPGTESATALLVECFVRAGVPPEAITLLGPSAQQASKAIEAGVDLVVLTGSAATGRKVLEQTSRTLTPAIMELSGCDAVIALPAADLERLAAAIDFGLNFNSGATCIAPRRLIVEGRDADAVIRAVADRLSERAPHVIHPAARESTADTIDEAIRAGASEPAGRYDPTALRNRGVMPPLLLDGVRPDFAIARADLFAPVLSVIRVHEIGEAVEVVNTCPYRLAASVFGPAEGAEAIAARLEVGAVTINDLIVPTADPRLPFGGRGRSGFGVTRGAEGLLAMTVPKVTSRRRGRLAPHLSPRNDSERGLLLGFLQFKHGRSLAGRLSGLRRGIRNVKTSQASPGSRAPRERSPG